MPSNGDMWFFVEPHTTIQEFKTQCKSEDTEISQIDVMLENGFANETDLIY
jgi:hypothetical protein